MQKKQSETSEKTQPDLYCQAAWGGFWSFATRIALRFILVLRIFILAWLLEPQDFGLLGVALLTVAIIESLTTTGFQAALVQKKGVFEDCLDSVWAFGLVRGGALFGILYLTAPYTALFFDCPQATSIIRVIGVSVILRSLSNVGTIRFQKELKFKKQFLLQSSGTVVDFIVSVSLACLYRNVWALVAGKLAGEFARLVFSYALEPYRPRLQLKIKKIRELWKFGRWILGSVTLEFLLDKGDDIIVGKIVGVTSLGLYRIAYNISNLPTTEITCAISQVTFPAYAKIQDDIPRFKAAYLK
ncbi:MAG: lipopolysaccharide biosynthesis protein, partial [Bacteroidales bacterium]|nr:lipopolysaccharide biosynthesis protein [Bacteroidales bacterium]